EVVQCADPSIHVLPAGLGVGKSPCTQGQEEAEYPQQKKDTHQQQQQQKKKKKKRKWKSHAPQDFTLNCLPFIAFRDGVSLNSPLGTINFTLNKNQRFQRIRNNLRNYSAVFIPCNRGTADGLHTAPFIKGIEHMELVLFGVVVEAPLPFVHL
ncbi:hypothetical protein TcCL_ESM04772, partial [Trypanosoma cruzi]